MTGITQIAKYFKTHAVSKNIYPPLPKRQTETVFHWFPVFLISAPRSPASILTWLSRRAGSVEDLVVHLSQSEASEEVTVVGFFKVNYLLVFVGFFLLV